MVFLPILAGLGIFFAVLFGGMFYMANFDKRRCDRIIAIISELGSNTTDSILPAGKVAFRKSPIIGILCLLLFITCILGQNFELGTLNEKGIPLERPAQIIGILFTIIPLLVAIWRWRYRIVISEHGLEMRSFGTKVIAFAEISKLSVETFKGSSTLVIHTRSGNSVDIGFALVGFQTFVRLLVNKVNQQMAK